MEFQISLFSPLTAAVQLDVVAASAQANEGNLFFNKSPRSINEMCKHMPPGMFKMTTRAAAVARVVVKSSIHLTNNNAGDAD